VITELTGRGLPQPKAEALVETVTAADATEQVRAALKSTDEGVAGLEEIDTVLALVRGQVPDGRVVFTPRMVRGLSYYTGTIWEVAAPGMPGSIASGGRYDHLIETLGGPDMPGTGGSLGVERILGLLSGTGGQRGRLDVAVTVMGDELAPASFGFAAVARAAGARASVYLGSSGKLGRQLKWASDAGARYTLIYGRSEQAEGNVIIRDMTSGDQMTVAPGDLGANLTRLLSSEPS
jgi:histidyl-tRNA synthetase